MTQGLQFSLLFSAMEPHAAADTAVFVPEQQDASYGEQAAAFRQVLESEQHSKGANQGQAVAAHKTVKPKELSDSSALHATATKDTSFELQTTEPEVQADTEPALSEMTEDVAEQWLGLIRQSSDASSLLRQKAELTAQAALLASSGQAEELVASSEELPLLKTAADLLEMSAQKQQSSLAAAIKQGLAQAQQPLLDSGEPAADGADMPSLAAQITDKGVMLTDKAANNISGHVSPVKPSTDAEQTATKHSTALDVAAASTKNLGEGQNALLASALKDNVTQAEPSQNALIAKTPGTRADAVLDAAAIASQDELAASESEGLVNSNRQPHAVIAENNSATKRAENAVIAGTKTLLNDSEEPELAALRQETPKESTEPLKAALTANTNPLDKTLADKPIAANTLTAKVAVNEATTDSKVEIAQQVPLHVKTAAEIAQGERAAISGKNTSTVKTTLPTADQAANDSGKLNMEKVSADNTGKESQSEHQQQRQDGRQYNFSRLEVSVQQNSAPSSVIPPAAASEQKAEANNLLLRAEQISSSLEQQNRPQSTTTAAPSLAEQLKQLNLQRQDAAGQLRERVQLMVRQNIQFAEIRLDPAELGQMQIKINLQQEQATVQFIVQQQQAKELLEQQMPRLRELLQQQGMQLSEGQVQQQAKDDRPATEQQFTAGNTQQGGEAEQDETAQTLSVKLKHSDRLVDFYA